VRKVALANLALGTEEPHLSEYMNLETFIQHFGNSFEDLGAEKLQPETRFKALPSWDSLALLTVTDTIDIEYGVTLSANDFRTCHTLAELYDLVKAKK